MTCPTCRARNDRHLRNCPEYLEIVAKASRERDRAARLFGLNPNYGGKK